MTDKFIIEPKYVINNSDINVVGEMLGYDWNDVCDMTSEERLYGQDGSGGVSVSRTCKFDNEDLNKIFEKIFADNPEVESIMIVDDF